MRPPIFAVLMAVLVWSAVDAPARAGIVRDGKANPANPAVDAGGVHPGKRNPPPVPYSLIGAIATEAQWHRPWRFVHAIRMPPRRVQERMMFRSFNAVPLIWIE